MIGVPFPHMALNSHETGGSAGVEYQMWTTWRVPAMTSVKEMVGTIADVALSAPGGSLSTVIINSHGSPGHIGIGMGISLSEVGEFSILKKAGLVERIWIVACKVAQIKKAGSTKTDGNYLCYRLAQESGAFIKASKDRQWGWPDFPLINEVPYGFIDGWEGTVYTWNPKGEIIGVDVY